MVNIDRKTVRAADEIRAALTVRGRAQMETPAAERGSRQRAPDPSRAQPNPIDTIVAQARTVRKRGLRPKRQRIWRSRRPCDPLTERIDDAPAIGATQDPTTGGWPGKSVRRRAYSARGPAAP